MGLNLQISMSKIKSSFKNTELLSNLGWTPIVRFPFKNQNKKGVNIHAFHIGGAKVSNNVIRTRSATLAPPI